MDRNMKISVAGIIGILILLSFLLMLNKQSKSAKSGLSTTQMLNESADGNKAFNSGSPANAVKGTKARVTTRRRKHSYYFPPKKTSVEQPVPVEIEPLEEDPDEEKVDAQGYKIFKQEEIKEALSLMQATPISIDSTDESLTDAPMMDTGMVKGEDARSVEEQVNEQAQAE